MGLIGRRPILPAPTDSLLGSTDDTGLGTDLGTELSRRTDRTSETIPDDGRPITITTSQKRKHLGKLPAQGQQSQTSLLIEYFEGSHESESGRRRPSLRVRVTPSKSKKDKAGADPHLLVTEPTSARQPSQTHRISLGGNETLAHNIVEGSISSLDSPEAHAAVAPVEIDVHRSGLAAGGDSPEARYLVPGSDISSMPPESLIGPVHSSIMSPLAQESDPGVGPSTQGTSLKPPVFPVHLNASNERITQKVIEKLSNKPRARAHASSGRHTTSRSASSREVEAALPDPQTRRTKNIDDDSVPSFTGSSVVSGSHLSTDARPTDQRSVRSGTSNVSITNNPRLLQTVEDAIRRLILPELNEIRRDQKHSHRSRYDKLSNPSDLSSSTTVSRDDHVPRKSSGSKSRRRTSGDLDHATHTGSSRRHRHRKTVDYDSPSEQSYDRSESFDSESLKDTKRSQKHHKSHRARDVAAGALGGAALTAAALKSHESGSSLDYSEHRRRRKSKSRSSRSASLADRDDAFERHQVPPMPFVSETGTDLTRSSLQSSNDGGTATPTRREVQEVIRGSPLEPPSSESRTPTGSPLDIKRGLGTHHQNFSEHNLTGQDVFTRKGMLEAEHDDQAEDVDFTTHGFAALTDPERARAYERNLHQQHPIRRGLSPIQSVASYATTEPNRNSILHPRSSESLASVKKREVQDPVDGPMDDQISITSLSSPPSTDLARSRRPHGISLENRSEIMAQHATPPHTSPHLAHPGAFDERHLDHQDYPDSPYIDKVTAGRQVGQGLGATAEYIDSSSGVESAVASLVDPSFVDVHHAHSPRSSHASSLDDGDARSGRMSRHEFVSRSSGSPLKQQISFSSQRGQGAARQPTASPAQSPAYSGDAVRSARSHSPVRFVSGPAGPAPAEHSPDSDITTNPSIIRGPIGGLTQVSTDHWPYDPTPPHSRGSLELPPASRDLSSAGAALAPEALVINRDAERDLKRDVHMSSPIAPTPPGVKDEGYETGANARSPGLYSAGDGPHTENFTPDLPAGDDPFLTNRDQYGDGPAPGMSPIYETGAGRSVDHIQSRDIVALMDHLTVRDAQRNARDTEILVTLVRSAAEMRNSFEDMKKFIAEQDEIIMDTADRQHDRTQKIIGAPRASGVPAPRLPHPTPSEDDIPAKRRNVFQRALKGLGTKNSAEIQNIEAMLLRLLAEVEALRAVPPPATTKIQPRATSLNSTDNARAATDTGYEPEGQAGTSSTGDRSGIFSNNSSRQADYRNYSIHRDSGNRVSTVIEGDEDYDDYGRPLGPATAGNVQAPVQGMTSTPPKNDGTRHLRGGSVPLNTPPRMHDPNIGSLSNDNTPHLSLGEGSSRKHKSFASSFIPKMVSRWSKTTASTDNYRNSGQRMRPYSEHSQSGSQIGEYDYDHDAQGDDRIRSNASFQRSQYPDEDDRPPSPLIPSQVSENPKYQAHRNSVNLQHPQPRQGPTGRFQSRLESEAQYYNDQTSPTSQTSSQWDQHPGTHHMNVRGAPYDRHGMTHDGYSGDQTSQLDGRGNPSVLSQGPPRPPKVPDEEPLVPQRPPKVLMSPPPQNRQQNYVDHVAAARAGSPAVDKSPVAALRSPNAQARKPSGPRPLTSSASKGEASAIKRTRFRGSPNQIDSDDEVVAAY